MEATKYKCIGFAHLLSEFSLVSFEFAIFTGDGYVVGGIHVCNLITVLMKSIHVVHPIRPAHWMAVLSAGGYNIGHNIIINIMAYFCFSTSFDEWLAHWMSVLSAGRHNIGYNIIINIVAYFCFSMSLSKFDVKKNLIVQAVRDI